MLKIWVSKSIIRKNPKKLPAEKSNFALKPVTEN
nr:MAG TPA: hypothetical protein [Caudoviricetes sp.]